MSLVVLLPQVGTAPKQLILLYSVRNSYPSAF